MSGWVTHIRRRLHRVKTTGCDGRDVGRYKPLPPPPQSKADVKNIVAQVVQKMLIHHEQAEEFRHRNKREGIWVEGWGPFSLGVPGHDVILPMS